MKIIDGSTFWAPHEGLECARNLLRLEKSQIARDFIAPLDCSKSAALRHLAKLMMRVQSLRKRFGEFIEGEYQFEKKLRGTPPVARIQNRDVATLSEVRQHMMQYHSAVRSGLVGLTDLEISFPTALVRFTVDSYFDFIVRSLDEADVWTDTGKLVGPKSGDVY